MHGEKPKCSCWEDPQMRAMREQQVDGLGTAIQASVMQACMQMGICDLASTYVAGSVFAAIVYWVAYTQRGDQQDPTLEQIAAAAEQVVKMGKERLEGARWKDLDRMPVHSDMRN